MASGSNSTGIVGSVDYLAKDPTQVWHFHGPQTTVQVDGTLAAAGPWADIRAYGARLDGVTDDTAAIQAAADVCRLAGGGTVYLPPGAIRVALRTHPQNPNYHPAFWVGANTQVVGAGRHATRLVLAPGQPYSGSFGIVMNYNIGGGGSNDENIAFRDFVLDGTAATQTAVLNGIHLFRAGRCSFERVRIRDIWGQSNTAPLESFFYEVGLCGDISFLDCQAIASPSGANTASGFSADGSTGIHYGNCVAVGLGFGQGFTHNACADLAYANCSSYLNGSYGFNSEVSRQVRYTVCQAGGQAATSGGGNGSFPYANNQVLGNGLGGFVCSGSTDLAYAACVADHNTGPGFWFANSARRGSASGYRATNNTGSGVFINADSASGNVVLDPAGFIAGNGAPITYDGTNTCDLRTYIAGVTLGASTATYANPFPFDVFVRISGTNISALTLAGGNLLPLATGSNFVLPAGASFTITYGAATPAMQVWSP